MNAMVRTEGRRRESKHRASEGGIQKFGGNANGEQGRGFEDIYEEEGVRERSFSGTSVSHTAVNGLVFKGRRSFFYRSCKSNIK